MLFFAFIAACVLALTSGLMVVLERNVVVSALDLAMCLVSVGAIYLMLDAYMLAAIQVFVYAGAVVVLFLFVIMLLQLGHDDDKALKLRVQLYAAPALATVLFLFMTTRLLSAGPFASAAPLAPDVAAGRPAAIGQALLVTYLYPFEVVSVLLLVAVVAALVTARRRLT